VRESSGTAANLTDTPSGGGGVSPLGDRFQPDLVRGTGNYSIPLHLPRGPNDLQPQFQLTYSSGGGDGAFGLGWHIGAFNIQRRADRGVPQYEGNDEFVIAQAGLLVPVGDNKYRPQADNVFWDIQRIGDHWRVRRGDGSTLFFGRTEQGREHNGGRVFAWHLEQEVDSLGNSVNYSYRRDGDTLYLEEISYSVFSLRFIYEERPTPLRNGRAGFVRTTALRASRLELHCEQLAPATLMRTYTLTYEDAKNGASLLKSCELSAEQGGETARFPTLTFRYTDLDEASWTVDELESQIPPPSLDDAGAQFVDLDGDALPGVLKTGAGGSLRWINEGDGVLAGPVAVDALPATVDLARNNVAFGDINGNGRVDLFSIDQPLNLAFESDGRGGFRAEPIVYEDQPNVRLSSANTRLMDFQGDGVVDLMTTEARHHVFYPMDTQGGWQPPVAVARVFDLDEFPDVSFDDPAVRLADMCGDGLQDVVVVQSECLMYWPYLGHGRWGSRIMLGNAPRLPDGFRHERLYLLDTDGSGCADLIYVDTDRILVWLNRRGDSFSDPIEVPIGTGHHARVVTADIYGDGRPSIVWNGSSSKVNGAGLWCFRFGVGATTNLLSEVDNGMGGRFIVDYTTTTRMRLEDRDDGRAWLFPMPIVVQVVREIRSVDAVSGRDTVQQIRYHDPVYDGPQREFRGFSSVTVTSPGDDSVPDSRQEITMFQGEPEHPDLVERERQRALAGVMTATRQYQRRGDGAWQELKESNQQWEVRVEHDGPDGRVLFPFLRQIDTVEFGQDDPDILDTVRFEQFDAFGSPGKRLRSSHTRGQPQSEWIRNEERFVYGFNEDNYLIRLPVRTEYRDGSGALHSIQIRHYDGEPFVGLNEGEATAGVVTRVVEARLFLDQLPADYLGGRDLEEHGYELLGAGERRGFYATTFSVRRDEKGNILEQKDPRGRSMAFDYDDDGVYPIRSVDAKGNETRLEFEPRCGEPRLTHLPGNRTVRYEYDPLGRLRGAYELDADGVEQLSKCWQLVEGSPFSIVSIVPRNTGTNREDLVAADLLTLPDATVSVQYYDGFGQEFSQVTRAADGPTGERRFVQSGGHGVNPKGLTRTLLPARYVPDLSAATGALDPMALVHQHFDADGHLLEIAGPGDIHFKQRRDSLTIQHFQGPALGGAGSEIPASLPPTRTEIFDARGRLTRIVERDGADPIAVNYDLTMDGRLSVMRDGDGNAIARYSFAGPGDPLRIHHRDIGARTYYYDAAGNLVERREPDGTGMFYEYDELGRPTIVNRDNNDGTAPETVREFFYDTDPEAPSDGRFLHGRLALLKEAGNSIRYFYNLTGQAIRQEYTTAGQTLAVERSYNHQGRLTGIRYPDGREISYELDDSGMVQGVPGVASDFRYDADGALVAYTLANGMSVEAPRDPATRQLQQLKATRNGLTLRQLDYRYDDVGSIRTVRDETPDDTEHQHYTYDELFRLASFDVFSDEAGTNRIRQGEYRYNGTGDLQRQEEAQAMDYTYGDPAHPGRVTQVAGAGGAMNLEYNQRGHVRSMGNITRIEYDGFERATRFLKADGTDIGVAYDHQGRRILKEVKRGGVVVARTRFVSGLFEAHAARNIRHIFVGTTVISSERVEAGTTEAVYYLADHHGTLLLAVDATGNVLANQRYSPFGAAWSPGNRLDRFLGRKADQETGFVQLGARYYSPLLGRFLAADWYVLENPTKSQQLPQGYNVYSYALNNPLAFKDPSGLFVSLIVGALIVLAYIAIVATVAAFAVGFVAGLVAGLSRGEGWGSLLTALETALTTTVGFWLGGVTGFIVGGPVGFWVGGVMGGMNGMISGMMGIYDWSSWRGWAAFVSDSTWGLVGTSLGNIVHIINVFWPDSNYNHSLSRRQNRHVYEGGMRLKETFAFTMGNVISNASQGGGAINTAFIRDHEELHIWQSRIFGPLFQATYIVWAVGGFIVANIVWLTDTSEDWGSLVETAAYYNNPFEYWAYNNDSNWPPAGSDPKLRWS